VYTCTSYNFCKAIEVSSHNSSTHTSPIIRSDPNANSKIGFGSSGGGPGRVPRNGGRLSSLLALRENGRLPCVKMFAVRFSSGARQTSFLPCVFRTTHVKQKRTYPYTLPCVFEGAHGNHKSLPCVFLGTHDNSSTLTFGRRNRAGRPLGADGRQALPCALEKRTAKTTSLPCVFVWRTAMYF
jgi:hypothetical protein